MAHARQVTLRSLTAHLNGTNFHIKVSESFPRSFGVKFAFTTLGIVSVQTTGLCPDFKEGWVACQL